MGVERDGTVHDGRCPDSYPDAGLPWRKTPGPGVADDAAIGELNFDDA
jgi:hypothetical protein